VPQIWSSSRQIPKNKNDRVIALGRFPPTAKRIWGVCPARANAIAMTKMMQCDEHLPPWDIIKRPEKGFITSSLLSEIGSVNSTTQPNAWNRALFTRKFYISRRKGNV
jgi:hypothetical protein